MYVAYFNAFSPIEFIDSEEMNMGFFFFVGWSLVFASIFILNLNNYIMSGKNRALSVYYRWYERYNFKQVFTS